MYCVQRRYLFQHLNVPASITAASSATECAFSSLTPSISISTNGVLCATLTKSLPWKLTFVRSFCSNSPLLAPLTARFVSPASILTRYSSSSFSPRCFSTGGVDLNGSTQISHHDAANNVSGGASTTGSSAFYNAAATKAALNEVVKQGRRLLISLLPSKELKTDRKIDAQANISAASSISSVSSTTDSPETSSPAAVESQTARVAAEEVLSSADDSRLSDSRLSVFVVREEEPLNALLLSAYQTLETTADWLRLAVSLLHSQLVIRHSDVSLARSENVVEEAHRLILGALALPSQTIEKAIAAQAASETGTSGKWLPAASSTLLHHSLQLIFHSKLTPRERSLLTFALIARICFRMPTAYILRRFSVSSDVELYVDERVGLPRTSLTRVLKYLKPEKAQQKILAAYEEEFGMKCENVTAVLDLCTGTGALSIMSANSFPRAAIDSVDTSMDALVVAKENLRHHITSVDGRVRLFHGDLFSALKSPVFADSFQSAWAKFRRDDHALRKYDIILADPPQFSKSKMGMLSTEMRYEPESAQKAWDANTASADDGAGVILRIVNECGQFLKPGGALLVDVSAQSESAVEDLLKSYDWSWAPMAVRQVVIIRKNENKWKLSAAEKEALMPKNTAAILSAPHSEAEQGAAAIPYITKREKTYEKNGPAKGGKKGAATTPKVPWNVRMERASKQDTKPFSASTSADYYQRKAQPGKAVMSPWMQRLKEQAAQEASKPSPLSAKTSPLLKLNDAAPKPASSPAPGRPFLYPRKPTPIPQSEFSDSEQTHKLLPMRHKKSIVRR